MTSAEDTLRKSTRSAAGNNLLRRRTGVGDDEQVLIRQLEYLVALAREGHFGRAATACWVSQPTLSEAINRLESELGVALVRRGRRYEGLTDEGERLVTWSRRVLSEHDEIVAMFKGEKGSPSGHLRLGAIPTALPPIPSVLAKFTPRFPDVTVEVRSMTSREILRGLESFELDVGLTYIGEINSPDYRCVELYREHYLLLTSADVPLQADDTVEWARVAALPLCLLTPDMQNRQILNAKFAEAGVAPAPHIETNSLSVLSGLVRGGEWSSVVPRSWMRLFDPADGLRAIPLAGVELTSQVGAVVLNRDPLAPVADAMLQVLLGTDFTAETGGRSSPDQAGDQP